MIPAAIFLLAAAMALVLIRAVKGATVYDRILAANAFGSITVAIVCLMSLYYGEWMYLDIALVYGLINFTGTIALLKYFRYGRFDILTDDETEA